MLILLTDLVIPFQSRHILAYVCLIARTNQYMYSFFPHTINLWNNLPDFVVHSASLATFKHSLQLYHCFNTVDVLAVRYFMHPLLLCINFIKQKYINKKIVELSRAIVD